MPAVNPALVLLRFPSRGRKDAIAPILLSGLQASCFGKNKKGTLIRQMRCCKALLGIQDVLAVAGEHFFSVFYICFRFCLQHLLLKIWMNLNWKELSQLLGDLLSPQYLESSN